MYYCTIYQQPSGKLPDKSLFELFISLSYLDKADAEKYKQNLIAQALENGGSVYLEDGEYTTITGKIVLRTTGIDTNRTNNRYKIGIESDATQFSALTLKAKASVPIYKTTDGLAYEVRVEELKQRKLDEHQAKQDEAAKNLKKFAAEIRPMKELEPVLRSFVRYSNKRTDKEKLALVAIKKINELKEI
jgi:hypothetical protein